MWLYKVAEMETLKYSTWKCTYCKYMYQTQETFYYRPSTFNFDTLSTFCCFCTFIWDFKCRTFTCNAASLKKIKKNKRRFKVSPVLVMQPCQSHCQFIRNTKLNLVQSNTAGMLWQIFFQTNFSIIFYFRKGK